MKWDILKVNDTQDDELGKDSGWLCVNNEGELRGSGEGKFSIHTTKSSNKVVLEGTTGSLGCIATIHVWWYLLSWFFSGFPDFCCLVAEILGWDHEYRDGHEESFYTRVIYCCVLSFIFQQWLYFRS